MDYTKYGFIRNTQERILRVAKVTGGNKIKNYSKSPKYDVLRPKYTIYLGG